MRQEHDPIDQVKKRLIDAGMADENKLKEIDKEIKDVITAAADYAQHSPEPDPSELWTEVYADA
jgi:pyruvate dehydrogenase E1 component alpha subunit